MRFSILALFTFLIILSESCDSSSSNVGGKGSSLKPEMREKVALKTKVEKKLNQNTAYPDFQVIQGNLNLDVRVKGSRKKDKVFIYDTEGNDYFLLDSLPHNTEGVYSKELKNIKPGVYKIGFGSKQNELGDFILNPAEKEIYLEFSSDNFRYGLTNTNSAENIAFHSYQKEDRKHKSRIKELQRERNSREEKLKSIYSEQDRFKRLQEEMASQNEGTFFAHMVRHLQSPNRFDKATYWSDIDFHDESLIHSPVYHERIQDYMRIHASKERSESEPLLGFYNAVDEIALKIKDNGSDAVLEFVLYTMSEGFYSSGMEELSLYVIDNYFYGDACGDAEISELFKMKAAGIRKLQVGNTPPDFTLTDPSGRAHTLSNITGKNKITLVLFWASFCHKCEREVPEIKKLYQKYNSQGFEVVAISVDTRNEDWTEAVRNHSGGWVDVSDLQGWRGETTKAYRVTSTPVMFVINRNREILARPKSSDELEQMLPELLSNS